MRKKIFLGVVLLLNFLDAFGAVKSTDPASVLPDVVLASERNSPVVESQSTLVFIFVTGLLLLTALILVYFQVRKKIRAQEAYSLQLLFSLEKEKEQIARDLHNSVGQNILFIKNQLIKNNQQEWLPAVDETIEKVRNISRELYPVSLEKFGLVSAVEALIDQLSEDHDLFVSHDLEILNKAMTDGEKITYYRLIEACVSNTLKHAQASALRISASTTRSGIELIVQDNGKGFDKTILAKSGQTHGLFDLVQRTKYLKGKFELETSPGKGTKCIFLIPE